jgi:putative phage-type endonuclease
MIQGTPEWFEARRGKITSSIIGKITKKRKDGKYSDERQNQLLRIVAEILTGQVAEEVTAKALAWGKDNEPKARAAYEVLTGNLVEEVGFAQHPTIPYVGGSPDGLVGTDGLIEIKCPYNFTVHLETILDGTMPEEHAAQVQANLWVTGRKWADFISFDPRFNENFLFVQRIERNEKFIEALADECAKFWDEVQQTIKKLGGSRNDAVEGSPDAAPSETVSA